MCPLLSPPPHIMDGVWIYIISMKCLLKECSLNSFFSFSNNVPHWIWINWCLLFLQLSQFYGAQCPFSIWKRLNDEYNDLNEYDLRPKYVFKRSFSVLTNFYSTHWWEFSMWYLYDELDMDDQLQWWII